MSKVDPTLTPQQLANFDRDGFLVVRRLFDAAEATHCRDHFMAIHALGPVEGYFHPKSAAEVNNDLLRVYPRVLLPHRWDLASRDYMLDHRLYAILRLLLQEEPLAAQSMFYFKPPGARGQAMHQDNFYLRVSPGTCLAAWVALDDTDEENGGLSVVPGSHKLPLLCPHAADLNHSFTIEEVDIPSSMRPQPLRLAAGDALFFNGSVIHGSGSNRTTDRFRRSFICHYVGESTLALNPWNELLNFEGEQVTRMADGAAGPCGTDELELLKQGALAQGELALSGREQGAL